MAGIKPNRTPVASDTIIANAATRQSTATSAPCSPTRGRLAVLIDSSARIPAMPSTSPSTPPTSDNTMLS
jgi:hypothetical protein